MNRALLPPQLPSGHRENSDRCECHGDGRQDNESYLETRYILLTARYGSVHSRVVPPEIESGLISTSSEHLQPLPSSPSCSLFLPIRFPPV